MLCGLYNDTREVLDRLDDDFKKTLQKRLGDFEDFRTTLEESIKNLEPRDQYVVLVAGRKFDTIESLQISHYNKYHKYQMSLDLFWQ